jgi:hypothetical protein
MNQSNINLSNLISTIRTELEEMEKKRIECNKEPMFQLKSMNIEINFVVEESSAGDAGFDIRVIKAGLSTKYTTSEIQKILLTFDIPNIKILGVRLHENEDNNLEDDIEKFKNE